MQDTPSSDNSFYFDAPIANFNSDPMATSEPQTVLGQSVQPNDRSHVENVGVTPSEPVAHEVQNEATGVVDPNGSNGWLPATDSPLTSTSRRGSIKHHDGLPISHSRSNSAGYAPSNFTNAAGYAVDGSTFINGAGTTGPNTTPEVDESVRRRAESADASLTAKQRSKISKAETKEGRSFSKIIKQEAKVEKQALQVAIKELGELATIQKASVKREAQAHTSHSKIMAIFQKHEATFLAAKVAYEASQAKLNAESEALEISRSNAREATERMQAKTQEIESLRTTLQVDEREREVKLGQLGARKSGSWWR